MKRVLQDVAPNQNATCAPNQIVNSDEQWAERNYRRFRIKRWCVWAKTTDECYWEAVPMFRTIHRDKAFALLAEVEENEKKYYSKYLNTPIPLSDLHEEGSGHASPWQFFVSEMHLPCFLLFKRLVLKNNIERTRFSTLTTTRGWENVRLPSEFGEPHTNDKIYTWEERGEVLEITEREQEKENETAKRYAQQLGFIPRIECYPNMIFMDDNKPLVSLDELYGEETLSSEDEDDDDEGDDETRGIDAA
jgi:hypothetical protein